MADADGVPIHVENFNTGQNTMMFIDPQNSVYKTGLKLDYSPNKLEFLEEFKAGKIE